jgi:alpha-glucosidase
MQIIVPPCHPFEPVRTLLRVRRERELGSGALSLVDLGDDIVAVDVATSIGTTRVVVNLGDADWPIPADARVLVASCPDVSDRLPTDHAVWMA